MRKDIVAITLWMMESADDSTLAISHQHTIRDENDLVRHIDYIHRNPVKHGLVLRVRDWPHSSFYRYVRMGWLAEDWGGDAGDPGGGFGEPIGR